MYLPICSTSRETKECCTIISDLQNTGKQIVLQWIPSHCNITGNDKADYLAKKKVRKFSKGGPTGLLVLDSGRVSGVYVSPGWWRVVVAAGVPGGLLVACLGGLTRTAWEKGALPGFTEVPILPIKINEMNVNHSSLGMGQLGLVGQLGCIAGWLSGVRPRLLLLVAGWVASGQHLVTWVGGPASESRPHLCGSLTRSWGMASCKSLSCLREVAATTKLF